VCPVPGPRSRSEDRKRPSLERAAQDVVRAASRWERESAGPGHATPPRLRLNTRPNRSKLQSRPLLLLRAATTPQGPRPTGTLPTTVSCGIDDDTSPEGPLAVRRRVPSALSAAPRVVHHGHLAESAFAVLRRNHRQVPPRPVLTYSRPRAASSATPIGARLLAPVHRASVVRTAWKRDAITDASASPER